MNLLNRVTIKSRLWGAAVLMLLFFLAFGLFSLRGMRELDQLTWKLYNHPLQVSNAALRAGIYVYKIQYNLQQAILARSESEIAVAVQEIREAEGKVCDNLNTVRDKILGATGQALERENREMLDGWKQVRREILELLRKGDKTAAIALTLGPENEVLRRLENKMLALRDYARWKATGFMETPGSNRSKFTKIPSYSLPWRHCWRFSSVRSCSGPRCPIWRPSGGPWRPLPAPAVWKNPRWRGPTKLPTWWSTLTAWWTGSNPSSGLRMALQP